MIYSHLLGTFIIKNCSIHSENIKEKPHEEHVKLRKDAYKYMSASRIERHTNDLT
jgi:hypothetical protein